MRTATLLTPCLLATLILNCASCPQGEHLRRYASYESGHGTGLIEISGFVTNVPPAARPPAILSLGDRAQQNAVQAFAQMPGVTTPEALVAAVSMPLLPESSPTPVIDRTRFQKRIVLSALRTFDQMGNPADRIDELLFDLTLSAESRTVFLSWDRFSTQDESVDLGKVSLKTGSATQLSLKADGSGAGVPVSGGLTQTWTRDETEEMALAQRRVKLAGVLAGTRAQIYQQGIRNTDISGTAQIDVVLQVEPDPTLHPILKVKALTDENGWVSPEKLTVTEHWLRIPASGPCPVSATLQARYRLRRATRNHQTYGEGDDRASYLVGTAQFPSGVELLSDRDLEAFAWRLVDSAGFALLLEDVGGNPSGELLFASEGEANAFLTWISEARHTAIRGRKLRVVSDPADPGRSRVLQASDVTRLAVSVMPLNRCHSLPADSEANF